MKTHPLILVAQWSSKFLVLLTFFSFFQNISFAQDCETLNADPQEAAKLPWFGNPAYLPSFMDSVRAVDGIPSQNTRIVPSVKWRIPIKFWILTEGI